MKHGSITHDGAAPDVFEGALLGNGGLGAAFPHSAYPVPMATNPYPDPSWGWEVCETPWAVQSLWWHYLTPRTTTTFGTAPTNR